jgi:hypothetical protein
MANQTKAQLVDELIRLRAHSDHVETQLQVAVQRNAELAKRLATSEERLTNMIEAARELRKVARPAYQAAAEQRRALSRRYFMAYPSARSVTDEQLHSFAAEFA